MPYEGGLYQWSKLAFNDFVAFMVGWNLWVFAITILAGTGLVVTQTLLRDWTTAAWIRDSR
jgi:amino acid transporter